MSTLFPNLGNLLEGKLPAMPYGSAEIQSSKRNNSLDQKRSFSCGLITEIGNLLCETGSAEINADTQSVRRHDSGD